jgi:cyclase
MDPADANKVAAIFEESDAGELPRMIGVSQRTLLRFHDLYFHLVEAEQDITANLYRVRQDPLFSDVNTKLADYIRPYDPNWLEPRDAMATTFYHWETPPTDGERGGTDGGTH